jgi:mRNA-degrading endonuclease toxin of MazEF toxin-antitoxin module
VWEFWRYYEWMNVWNEISKDGKNLRPCVVLKNNTWNKLILIAPLTSKYHHRLSEYYIQIPDYIGLNTVSFAVVNQIKLIDKYRLSWVVRWTIRSRSVA